MEAARQLARPPSPAGGAPALPARPRSTTLEALSAPDLGRLTEAALMDLCDAYRRDGKARAECFQRLGAARYAALLREVGSPQA